MPRHIRRLRVISEQARAFVPLVIDVIEHTDRQSVEIERLRRRVKELENELKKYA